MTQHKIENALATGLQFIVFTEMLCLMYLESFILKIIFPYKPDTKPVYRLRTFEAGAVCCIFRSGQGVRHGFRFQQSAPYGARR